VPEVTDELGVHPASCQSTIEATAMCRTDLTGPDDIIGLLREPRLRDDGSSTKTSYETKRPSTGPTGSVTTAEEASENE
jgi:hypothetical protein